MTVLVGARVVAPDGVLSGGWVRIHGNHIAEVGDGSPPDGARVDVGGGWLLPGFIDTHVHGGGGNDFGASEAELVGGMAYHQRYGTTRTLASLVAAPVASMCEQLSRIAALAEAGPGPGGHVVGAHLEGPFLSAARCGAQHPGHLLKPDLATLADLLAAGRGFVRSMTVAPELPGALEVIDHLVEAGVVAAVGHTDATYDEAAAAFARGATVLTHAYNAMRSPHHREPGPVAAALDGGAYLEVINDGLHLHPAAIRLIGHGRLVLVTDAIDAAGRGDGRYRLGGQDVEVVAGQARLSRTGALAGSTLTMAEAVRRAVSDVGMPIETAALLASGHPARVLGIADRCGFIASGLDADLVVLDDELRVTGVMAQGRWQAGGPSRHGPSGGVWL